MDDRYSYKAFGLRIVSELPFTELCTIDAIAGSADVVVGFEDLSALWDEWEMNDLNNFVSKGTRLLFKIPDTAVYCVDAGCRISVMPDAGSDMDKVRLYVLGTCMGALLMQREILPLHGSAIVIDGRAYAFVGESGAGKSTLAAAFVNGGYPLLCDDVIAISLPCMDEDPVVQPAYPQQKLWEESMLHFDMKTDHYVPVYQKVTKFAVPVTPQQFYDQPVTLAGVFELVKSDRGSIVVQPLQKLERLHILMQHTYRNALISRLGLQRWHFSAAVTIAKSITGFRLQRPSIPFTAHDLSSEIIKMITMTLIGGKQFDD